MKEHDALRHFEAMGNDYDPEGGLRGLFIAKEREAVISLLDPQPGEKILDAGCGNGYYTRLIARAGARPYGVDISPAMIMTLKREGLPGHVADIMMLNLRRTFDKVLCSGALEFVADPGMVLHNLLAHTSPGGKLILLAPRCSLGGIAYRVYHWAHGVHVTLFTRRELEKMLQGTGSEPGRCIHPHAIAMVIEFTRRF